MFSKYLIFFAIICITFAIQLPAEFLVSNCQKGYPYYSVGDVYLNDSNYTSIISNSQILLIATLKSCKTCCQHETLFDQIKLDIQQNPEYQFIKIGRLELTQNKNFQSQFKQIKRFPFIIYFDGQGKHHIYQDILDKNRILRFIQRIFNPIMKFDTFKSLDEYINKIEYDQDNNPIENVKVIGLFFDRDEMKQEIEYFEEVSRDLLSRSELYFCLLTKKSEVKQAKKYYQDKWFEGVSLNSIVIQRSKDNYNILDLSDLIVDMKNLKQEIIANSLRLVDEFTLENYQFYQKDQNKQILVAVLDSIIDFSTSKRIISILEQLAKQFLHKLHITWVEGNLNPEKKKMLGIPAKSKLPQIAFFRIDYATKVILPSNIEINYQNLYEFVNDYFTLSLFDVQKKYMNYEQKLIEQKLLNTLTTFTQLKEKNFIQKIIQFDQQQTQSSYILFYLFELDENKLSQNNDSSMKELNQVGNRIQQLYGNTSNIIQFFYSIKQDLLDSESDSILRYVENLKPNTLYFYMSKKPIPYKGVFTARKILEFISSTTKKTPNKMRISFPKYPEIQEEKIFEFLKNNKTSQNIC